MHFTSAALTKQFQIRREGKLLAQPAESKRIQTGSAEAKPSDTHACASKADE